MRFKEIISEAPARYDDMGQPIGPAPGTVAAAQADAARIAQGDKNLNAVKGFFGMKPTELKDAPPGTSIDPIQRSRMGYKPATQKEIADFQAANPNYGKVVGGDGKPIKTGDGSDLVSGGGAAVVQTAQAAAPQTKGDAHAGQGGYEPATDTGDQGARLKGRYPAPAAAEPEQLGMSPEQLAAASAAKPAAAPQAAPAAAGAGGYGTGMNNPSVAPAAGTTGASSTDAATAAAADADRKPVTDTGVGNTPLSSEKERLQTLAGIVPAAPAAAAPPAAAAAPPPAAEVPAAAPPAAAQAAEPAAAAAVVDKDSRVPGQINPADAAKYQPAPAAGPVNRDKMSFGQAFADARAKGEKTFSWKKGSYSTAKAGENPALDKGIARNAEQRSMAGQPGRDEAGKPGGGKGSAAAAVAPAPAAVPAAPAASAPATPASAPAAPAKPAAPPAAAPPRPAAAPGQSPRIPPAATKNQKESQEINRMRFLAGLSKD